ncbi:type I-E CRISPR-associated protein Cse2/CasB [Wenjunlia tyrosinilytica]|uniref:Type I-E CRISPR-associated protein Cse2/CasB n=1 Tax=Wenjunlia tyrosinilytica TaxID=1544741 RepID=A0A918E2E0_9ACTN|nr:type I-E CRISPR-associated protein Cse2/CasB [Wenjunlia tyrosinilytica]GGO99247.1 hypothetical protein GCM10012280_65260 [Wenjunlia tyrosinilytica]
MTTSPTPSAQTPAEERHSEAFVRYVLGLCERDKGVRADLRSGRGLPVERCNRLHRYLVPRLSEDLHPDAKRAHYAVAALIADRPRAARDADAARSADAVAVPALDWWKRPNLGASLATGVNKKLFKPSTAESDLHLMARQNTEAIHPRLPSMARYLQGHGVAVDWAVLLEDLTWWNYDRDRIATRWLESYFRVRTFDDRADTPSIDTDAPEETN